MLSGLLKKAGSDLALTMLEIGALPVGSEKERFHTLLDEWVSSKVVAFEPDVELCRELNSAAPWGINYYPCAVAKSRGSRVFYETAHSMCGSLFPPDERYADVFHNLEVMRLKQTSLIDTTPLDEFVHEQSTGPVDFIKLDIQGAELEALQGAVGVLKNVVFIICEVEFVPLYKGQPLFGEVDAFLRSHGFVFHKFLGGSGRTVKPLIFNGDANQVNQHMWADAVFIRDLFHMESLSSEQLQKLALFTALYDSPDVALFLLGEYDKRMGTKLGEQYLQALTLPSAPKEEPKRSANLTLSMADGVKIVVPDSLDLITTYVLSEQLDWFEEEIKFLRRLLQPGQKIIDIGANYGAYTSSMANTIGPTGCVWAFEPASSTARFLAETIAVNAFPNIVLERSALSSASGSARLSLNANSELNALVRAPHQDETYETVELVTLDGCMKKYNWSNIEFVKMDAEGEEANILQGGKAFFDRLSPLVQYEIRAGDAVHVELVEHFTALGYESYRLVPGLNVLVPIDLGSIKDGYLLNLFCCKEDRARILARQGFLVNPALVEQSVGAIGLARTVDEGASKGSQDWRSILGVLPYGRQLFEAWNATIAAEASTEVEDALSQYAISQDSSRTMAERYSSLEASFLQFTGLCERDPSNMRLASLARVACEFGDRACAVRALQRLLEGIVTLNRLELREPFLAPSKRFDLLPTDPSIENWLLAAVLEEIELLGAYSSYYTGVAALQRLTKIRDLGFGSAEMARRLSLVQKRFGLGADEQQAPANSAPSQPFPPSVVLAETRSGRMLVPVSGQQGAPLVAGSGDINPEELSLLSQFVGAGDIVLDVGAGCGIRTVPLANLTGPSGVVVAFEPQPMLYKTLCANTVLNSLPNVLTYAMALGACEGECQLRVVDASPASHPGSDGNGGLVEDGEVVPLGKLDDFQLDRVDFIRLAVGGNEATVLEGAAETIGRCRPIMYINNEAAERSADLIQHLFDLGYRLWWHASPEPTADTMRAHAGTLRLAACSMNMLCIHRNMEPIEGLKQILSASARPLA